MNLSSQTFQPADLISVLFLVVLEAALSADNALVLAVMVRPLSKENQKKALIFGLGAGLVFRAVAIILATLVLRLWWLQALGGLYLVVLPFKALLGHHRSQAGQASPKGLWQTIAQVEMTDLIFALDSVLAGVGFINNRLDKIWVVYFGAIIGIVFLRFVARGLVSILERYPILDKVAYSLVLWVGVKLSWLALSNFTAVQGNREIGEMPGWLFWSVLVLVAGGGTALALWLSSKKVPRTGPSDSPDDH